MIEREKLIGLIKQVVHVYFAEDIADHLLANNLNFVEQGRNLTENHPVDEFICSECCFICEGWAEVIYDPEGDYLYHRECEFDFCPKCGSKIENFWKARDNK